MVGVAMGGIRGSARPNESNSEGSKSLLITSWVFQWEERLNWYVERADSL